MKSTPVLVRLLHGRGDEKNHPPRGTEGLPHREDLRFRANADHARHVLNAAAPPPRRTPCGTAAATTVMAVMALTLSACGLFDDPDAPPPTLPAPPEVDIAYGPAAGCEGPDDQCGGSQQLDIYRSDEPGPNPVLVWLHGGGFVSGDKAGVEERLQPVLDDGWDIVSVNYRLTLPDGTNSFPTGLHDANRAVRWIKANAPAQDWDADSVAAMGVSAGGNLVGMLATTSDDPSLQPPDLPPELAAQSPDLVAGITMSAVSDLPTFGASPTWDEVVADYTGCRSAECPALAQGSVATHVDANSAPLLAAHGVDDGIAPPAAGESLRAAYVAAGIGDRFELIIIDDGPEQNRGHNLDMRRIMDDVVAWLNRWG